MLTLNHTKHYTHHSSSTHQSDANRDPDADRIQNQSLKVHNKKQRIWLVRQNNTITNDNNTSRRIKQNKTQQQTLEITYWTTITGTTAEQQHRTYEMPLISQMYDFDFSLTTNYTHIRFLISLSHFLSLFILYFIKRNSFVSGVTILLSLTVFLNLVAETLPQVSDAIPLLGSDCI